MKVISALAALYFATGSFAFAQSSAGSSAGAGGTGSSLSNGNAISGTGGSPGPNTSNALNRGTTGNNVGTPQIGAVGSASASHSKAVDTPAANAATKNLGNTDAGVLKK